MNQICVIDRNNASNQKVIELKSTLNELKNDISMIFASNNNCELFKHDGSKVTDINTITNNDILYFTINEKTDTIRRFPNDWIRLNVGGKQFTTTLSTLVKKDPNCMLSKMFSFDNEISIVPSKCDEYGSYLIDRDPKYFEPILNFLRTGKLYYDFNINPEGILEEAKFFQIESLIEHLNVLINQNNNEPEAVLTRSDVIKALINTSSKTELRFQGVNLNNADLSKLDLSFINFKYAQMRNCNFKNANLTHCCLERADLSNSNLNGCTLIGLKASCSSFENAQMFNCNFEDPNGSKAHLESSNFKNVNLENSLMTDVNLRVANLKNAKLKNCTLRKANLAGSDLENCDLSGSDLHEANLCYANLKNVKLDGMITPIHMSQTIRY